MKMSGFQDLLFIANLKKNIGQSVVSPEYTKVEMLNIYRAYVHNHDLSDEVKEEILSNFHKDFYISGREG